MRILALTALTMIAFAANSVLNRAALADGDAGPAAFAAVRLVSGALCLVALVALRGGLPRLAGPGRAAGTLALALYMLGFSFAYVALDAGVGALILFGGVQITMFAGALILRERPPPARWIGSAIAFAGLAWLLWPGATGAPPVAGAALMIAAALGWGVYSLRGRRVTDPMQDTAANFLCAAPLALAVWLVIPDAIGPTGLALAILSGAVTSGMGYALWYSLLPRLTASFAAILQLSVPVIAVAAGVAFLGESVGPRVIAGAVLVLGGIALSLRKSPGR